MQDLNQPLNIVAYSFGTLPILEAMLELEARGINVNLVLLDGAPAVMKGLVDVHVVGGTADDDTYLQIQVTK